MTLNIEQRVKAIITEIKSLKTIGVTNPRILYTLTADFYKSQHHEFMSREDYDTAIKMLYREELKK